MTAAKKIKCWPKIRQCLLTFLEKGKIPWKQDLWPFPDFGLDKPKPESGAKYPRIDDLIEVALLEKKPDQVLKWYDKQPDRKSWFFKNLDNHVAAAIKTHAPERAVAIWKEMAENLINRVNPSAYQEASRYLRKVSKVLNSTNKKSEWDLYLKELRKNHYRKRRLMEILDGLEKRPILSEKN